MTSKVLSSPGAESDNWQVYSAVPAFAPEPDLRHDYFGESVGVYWYLNAVGERLGAVLRYNKPEGGKITPTLTFAQHIKTGAYAWVWKGFDKPRPIYGLDLLALEPEKPVLLVEGEKATDAARVQKWFYDYVCVTFPGGCNAWKHVDWKPLSGKQVYLWPDNDDQGKTAFAELAQHLATVCKEVRLVELPQAPEGYALLPQKWDVADAMPEWLDPWQVLEQARCIVGGEFAGNHCGKSGSRISLVCASDIKVKPISWLWPGYIAGGKFHIIAGQPGTGKTTIAIMLAAIISRGGKFPDGIAAKIKEVLIWTSEDSVEDTLIPRLIAAGADLKRIHFINGVQEGKQKRPFDPAKDMQHLDGVIKQIPNLGLIIVDPVVCAIAGDSHKNAEVRRGLQPLVDFGDKNNIAMLGITHLSKGSSGKEPLERIIGSIAFAAVARIAFIAAKCQEQSENVESEYRVFVRAKSNIGIDGGGFRYSLESREIQSGITTSVIEWGDTITGQARDILNEGNITDSYEGLSMLEEAGNFLKEHLIEGGATAKSIWFNAKEAGFSQSTIRRAKESLGVICFKRGKEGWFWKLPSVPKQDAHEDAQDAQEKNMSTFEHLEHLHSITPAFVEVVL